MYNFIMKSVGEEIKTRAEVRKWGHSFGLILPKDIARRHGIIERQIVELSIRKQPDVRQLFGSLKIRKPSKQIKNELKKEWKE